MNVLFVDPSPLEIGIGDNPSTGARAPHMGLMYMATYTKSLTKSTVRLVDMAASKSDFDDLAETIKTFKPDLVAITARTFQLLGAYRAASVAKNVNPKTVTILGGAHGSAIPDQTLAECPSVDAVAIGEGEFTLLEVVKRMEAGYSEKRDLFSGVAGIAWCNGEDEVVHNEPRPLMTDLDSLPFPDLTLIDRSKYFKSYTPIRKVFEHVYPISSSRGCPFRCTYCFPLLGRRHRVRSAESVLEEIEILDKKFGATRIYFEDSIFFLNKKWFADFCERYMERGYHKRILWGFETRVDMADEDMFRLAQLAGCTYVFFGQESGNEYVLKMANKGYTRDQIITAITSAKEMGIAVVRASIILGLPYDTRETIEETLSLLKALPYDLGDINLLMPYPGTPVFAMADNGEGGLRWIPGKRMNWAAYSRDRQEPLVEVNDVTQSDLMAARDRGRKILAGGQKLTTGELYQKRWSYAKELVKNDPLRLLRYGWETLRGVR